ncbi:SusC/RagA family TonB-linked outer membrane protein [Desertivirga arenae]|uniref:SusC/RagA family TonB-linked outer membrane protein n=1 Tax=Desertivirga arenae TaxID=2810309 RepID=UPI001A968E42|nr:TonB-dependent receptor [Pedobacter sp. SYSU D00823]
MKTNSQKLSGTSRPYPKGFLPDFKSLKIPSFYRKPVFTLLTVGALGLSLSVLPEVTLAQETKPLIQSNLVGTIYDAKTKEPLIGVTVQIKGTTHTANTNVQGKFTFVTGQKFPYTLVISYIGYEKQEVVVTGSPVTVLLKESANQLSDVVVVGYGTQRRKDVTGSVSSVKLDDVRSLPVSSPERLLQGTIPGIQVTQTSGQPGGGVSVQIRGNNSITAGSDPLYVIDGFPINNDYSVADAGVTNGSKINPMSFINSADIESIDVLKDASGTAIYGSRGANGVVIITTKTGKPSKPSINYDAYYGEQKVIRTLPLLNAAQWWDLRKDAARNSGKNVVVPVTSGYSLDTTGTGTDWQDAAFRQAPYQSHNLSILSGSERTRFAISGNYFKQDGVLENTDFIRYSGRVNVDHEYNKRLRIFSSIIASNTKAQVAPANIVSNLVLTPPSLPIYKDDGTFVVLSPFESALQNPINSLYNQINETRTNRLLGNFSGEYTLAKGLKAKVLFGVDVIDNKQNRYLPISTGEGQAASGIATIGTLFTSSWLNENTLTYDKEFGKKHRVNALVGFTAQESNSKGAIAEGAGFATDEYTYNNLGTGVTQRAASSSALKWALASYLGRLNYSFDGKYLATITLRADGSSRFGEGNKWGYFPSAALGWNVTSERFAKKWEGINQLKLRASAGYTGNQSIPPYSALGQINYYRYNFSNTTVSGFAPANVENSELGWEKTLQFDGGIDLGLFSNRIAITADYYYKKTTDLLLSRTVPGTSGLSDPANSQASVVYQNIGAVSNKGFELSVATKNLTKGFKWSTTVIYSINRNKILSLGDGVDQYIPSISVPSIAKVGYPLGSFIVYQADGVIQPGETPLTPQANKAAGGQKYKDLNGDGQITQADDRIVIKNQPGFLAGLTNNFSYKGFDFNVFFQASIGGKLYNQNRANLELATGYVNGSTELLNRWTPTNTNTDVKAAYQDPAITISDRFIEDASYVRLKSASFGYNFPKRFAAKIRTQNVRLYISGQNLVTWTDYTGFDPEASVNGQSLINRGIDNSVYPNNKSLQLGLSLSL